MTDYAVNDWAGNIETNVANALAALEVKLETIANTKTIRLIGITAIGDGRYFQAYLIYDA